MNCDEKKIINCFKIIIIILLFILPFYFFNIKLNIGGDDSRLYYFYPLEWIQFIYNSSWISYSSLGYFTVGSHFYPILLVFYLFKLIGLPDFVIQNLALSAVLIGGFLFFQLASRELLRDYKQKNIAAFLGGLIYILSPILLLTPLKARLAAIWLIPYLPLAVFFFLKYLRTSKFRYIAYNAIVSFLLSLALNAIPWLLGFAVPVSCGLFFTGFLIFRKQDIWIFIKKFSIFTFVILLSQSLWLLPFIASSLSPGSSVTNRVLSDEISSTFEKTVTVTSTGNTLLYPLINLFHRSIQTNFNWPSNQTYSAWHDPFAWTGIIYIIIFSLGLWYAQKEKNKVYYILIVSFLASLFFFTVKIGFLYNVFLWLGNIPGFVMFRNFYDKFALGYVLIYSNLLAFSLVFIFKYVKKGIFISSLVSTLIFVLFYNAKPLFTGEIINAPLWNTKDIFFEITIPDEYLDFMTTAKKLLPVTTNILSLPFGSSAYTIIKDGDSNNVFAGKSPVKLFTGVNDYSGTLSFPAEISKQFTDAILKQNYKKLRNLFSIYNIGYIFETRNIPEQVLATHLFDANLLNSQDEIFKKTVAGELLLSSINDNYRLHTLKLQNTKENSIITIPSRVLSLPASNEISFYDSPLLNIMEDHDVYVANFPIKEYSSEVLPLENLKTSSLTPGEYSVAMSNIENYSLTYNSSTGEIIVNRNLNLTVEDASLSLNNDASSGILYTKSPNEHILIKIYNSFYSPSEINNLTINKGDHVDIYHASSTANNLIGSALDIFESWERGDCNAHNSDQRVLFELNSELGIDNSSPNILTLRASESHNACLYKRVPLASDALYAFSVEYQNQMPGEQLFYLGFEDRSYIKQQHKNPGTHWNTVVIPFENSVNSYVQIYLYSGADQRESISSYRNIHLHEFEYKETVQIPDLDPRTPLSFSINETAPIDVDSSLYKTNIYSDQSLSEWQRGDCGAVDNNVAVFFEETDSGLFTLTSKDGHNACIYKSFDLNFGFDYQLSFDVMSEQDSDLLIYVGFDNIAPPFKQNHSLHQKEWVTINSKIEPPTKSSRMTVYLYSGKSGKIPAVKTYRDIKIHGIPKWATDISLIKESRSPIIPPQSVDVKKFSSHSYFVTIESAQSPFLLDFHETFHSGWRIYPSEEKDAGKWYSVIFNKPILSHHFQVNNFSNGWWIDPEKICYNEKGSLRDGCERRIDGSFDIDLVIEFLPQRFFYLGLLISGTTLLGCLGYLVYDWRKRRKT